MRSIMTKFRIALATWRLRRTLPRMSKILKAHGVFVTAPETILQAWDRTFPEPALEVSEMSGTEVTR
jgi:hypothetical protein